VVIAGLAWLWHGSTEEPPPLSPAPSPSEPVRELPVASVSKPVRELPVASVSKPVREQPLAPVQPRIPAPAATPAPPLALDSPPAANFDAAVQHTVNPCKVTAEPTIPEEYERVTAAGITVAWNPAAETQDFPFRPLTLAHAVVGVLDEAALLTGTARRAHLTVIVDGSRADFQVRTQASIWVAGFYDGGAVRLPAGSSDFGVRLRTLRHEAMHAQLHTAVGCMPAWFNEGLATYFGNEPPVSEWLAMLGTGEPFDLATLRDPTLPDPSSRDSKRMYAVAAAMIVYIAQRGALHGAVHTAQALNNPRNGQQGSPFELWEILHPGAGYRDVLDKLAERVFGMTTGPSLELVLRGPMCCTGMYNLGAFSCRAALPRASESSWRDTTSVPPATCRTRWW
jgi:hypothetical protein